MKKVHIVIGANFGDEGKGEVTNNVCKKLRKDKDDIIINVRFNGGAQAGHTVKHDGHEHVFHHFGSGSFNSNVITLLTEDFILNPIMFRQEYEELVTKHNIKPIVIIDDNCRVTLPIDMMKNQKRVSDTSEYHSCGIGILETIKSYEDDKRKSFKEYFDDMSSLKAELDKEDYSSYVDVESKKINENYLNDFQFMMCHCKLLSDVNICDYKYFVFEGAQGLLLDKDNKQYYPYLTPSNTGTKNAKKFIEKYIGECKVHVYYVSRPYLTRHGDGRFDTMCDISELGIDPNLETTNVFNDNQGNFKYGHLDTYELINRIQDDYYNTFDAYIENVRYNLVFTHLQDTNGIIKDVDGDFSLYKNTLNSLEISQLLYELYA